ncbi:auxin efflux carrier [Clostridia bacterium]|nr:auxin efflux carrier [Clostridia bacterium]
MERCIYQVALMALLCFGGFLCRKLKLVSIEGNRCLSALVLNVANPATIIKAFMIEYDSAHVSGLLFSGLLAVISIVVSIAAANIFFRGKDKCKRSIERFTAVYTNSSFLGLPLVQGIFGDMGVFFLAAYIAVFNIFIWTHGELSMAKAFSHGTAPVHTRGTALLKALKSPSLIAVAIGLLCFFMQIRLPKMAADTVGFAAGLTVPLAMIVAGVTISQTDLRGLFKKWRLYYVSFVELIIIPVILIGLFWLMNLLPLSVDSLPFGVTVVSAACPAATIGVILALKYDGKGVESLYAAEIFAMTTLLCLPALPLIMGLFEWVFK